jgi:hypothetical protein
VPVLIDVVGGATGSARVGASFVVSASWSIADPLLPAAPPLAADSVQKPQTSGSFSQGWSHTVSLTLTTNKPYMESLAADAQAAATAAGSASLAGASADPFFHLGPGVNAADCSLEFSVGIIDNPVPESSAALLMGLGLAALAWRRLQPRVGIRGPRCTAGRARSKRATTPASAASTILRTGTVASSRCCSTLAGASFPLGRWWPSGHAWGQACDALYWPALAASLPQAIGQRYGATTTGRGCRRLRPRRRSAPRRVRASCGSFHHRGALGGLKHDSQWRGPAGCGPDRCVPTLEVDRGAIHRPAGRPADGCRPLVTTSGSPTTQAWPGEIPGSCQWRATASGRDRQFAAAPGS